MKDGKFFETHEIAYKLKRSLTTIYRLIESGKLKAHDISTGNERKSYLVSEEDFTNFLAESRN